MPPNQPHVRAYRPEDRAAVRHICCETGGGGGGRPVESVFGDREVFADIMTRYYTDFEPENVFVGEAEGEIVGYLLGCTRPRRYAILSKLIQVFVVAPRVLCRLIAGRYDHRDRQFLNWWLLRSRLEVPRAPDGAAHFHFNLLPAHRNRGLGRRLYSAFLDQLATAGMRRLYGQIKTTSSRRGDRLFQRFGFQPYDRRELTKFRNVSDEVVWLTTFVRELPAPSEQTETP